jgi:hypothetical protein
VYSGTGVVKSEALKVLDAVHECAGIIDVLPEELQERVLAALCVTFGLGGLVAHQDAVAELSGEPGHAGADGGADWSDEDSHPRSRS